jgi:peptide-methionine (S)-S-oxide reductase
MENLETATFAAGCFWCVEAVFERLEGVTAAVAGYAGGTLANPTYEQVCSGKSGHAEVAQISYDPTKVTFDQLLDLFWMSHDPTTMNRQGADVGTQYRSAIFYENEPQKKAAEESKARAASLFKDSVVTQIVPLTKFYPAENYHQDYFRNNPDAPYCRFVIRPKLEKLQMG